MNNPKYRWKLNKDQLAVLELLYRFRFGSSELIAKYFDKSSGDFVYKRLKILTEQELIGKRFDKGYRIKGKPAAYYLLPEGGRKLQEHREPDDDPININSLYRLTLCKDGYVQHCMDIFAINLKFKSLYGDKLSFSTKADLNVDDFDYFPKPLPDAYIRVDADDEMQFFLDLYDDTEPYFTAVRKVNNYIEYSKSGNWATTETDLPVILAVCGSVSLQKRLQKRIVSSRNKAWDTKTKFALTSKDKLISGELAIWQPVEEPEKLVSLEELVLTAA